MSNLRRTYLRKFSSIFSNGEKSSIEETSFQRHSMVLLSSLLAPKKS